MLKPKEINDVQFSKALRGYDPNEVDQFLDRVVEDYSSLLRDNAELTAKLETAEHQLDEYKNAKDSLREARDRIYRMAQEVASKAKAEAAQTEREAKERAERIVMEAKRDSEAQRRLYERLQLEVTRFKGKAVALFKSEIEQLNSLPDIQMDGKDELRIRADELSHEDALSSPFVEEYKEAYRAPKEIDFGVPEEAEIPKKAVDLPPVDPAEDFALDYLSGTKSSGMLDVRTAPAEEDPVYGVPEDEPVKIAAFEEKDATEEPVFDLPDEPETAVQEEEPAVSEAETEELPEATETVESEPIQPEERVQPEPEAENEPEPQPESEPESPTHTVFTIRRVTDEVKGDTTIDETVDVIDTAVEEPKKTATPPVEHPKFGELRFGADYDMYQEESGSGRGFGLFKRKK